MALLRRSGTHAIARAPGPRISSAPRRRAALHPGRERPCISFRRIPASLTARLPSRL